MERNTQISIALRGHGFRDAFALSACLFAEAVNAQILDEIEAWTRSSEDVLDTSLAAI